MAPIIVLLDKDWSMCHGKEVRDVGLMSHESPPIPTLREKMSYIVFIFDKEWSNMAACQEL